MNENKLVLLMELYKEYWNDDEIDIDLANQIVNQIPSLVKAIKKLNLDIENYVKAINQIQGLTSFVMSHESSMRIKEIDGIVTSLLNQRN